MTVADRPYFTIVIATFNSGGYLPRVLGALDEQDFPRESVEVLVVDGGSTDDTLAIAGAAGCRIVANPRTEPVFAKYLGLHAARGRYAVYVDHDEVFGTRAALSKRRALFMQNPGLRALSGSGYVNPPGYPIINRYINDYGDAFSFFVYRLSKDARTFPREMKRRYGASYEGADGLVVDFEGVTRLPIIELCAMGATIDVDFFREDLKEAAASYESIPHLFYLMLERTKLLGVTKDDPILHYSSDTLTKYRNKIKWRVKNNVHHARTMGRAGFLGRERYAPPAVRILKYLFLPYALLVLPALVDALVMCVRKRNLFYLVHVPLAFYTAALIVSHSALRLAGYRPRLRSYDESTVIADD